MITEDGKMEVVQIILNRWPDGEYMNDWYSLCIWNLSPIWCNSKGELWAATQECEEYVRRIKKMKAFL